MRLNKNEVELIRDTIDGFLGNVRVYLFGSRLNEKRQGGDIDLFIDAEGMDYVTKLKLRAKLKQLLHKPVDIVYHTDYSRDIEREARKGVILQ